MTAAARDERARVSPFAAFIARRFGRLMVSLVLLVSAAFAMVHAIPGDPVRAALGLNAPQALVEQRRHDLGLDRPLADQYYSFITDTARGRLGTSMISDLPVSTEISNRLPATLELAGLAFLVTLGLGIPVGLAIGVATHHGRSHRTDVAFSVSTGALATVPQFLLGVALVFLFAVSFEVFPVAGRAGASSFVLPVLSLALGPAALLARIVRVETHRVLDESYIQTARAKRLAPRRIYVRHVLPNALAATLTVAGLILASLLAGTVLVENIFAWPGLGTVLVQSILAKDFPLVQGLALVFGAGVLLINAGVDIALAVFDPRSTIATT